MGFKIVNGGLLVSTGGLPIDCSTCPCGVDPFMAILFLNSNSYRDDNFSISLNGTTIGTIDNSTTRVLINCGEVSSRGQCSGRIFAEDTGVTDWVGSPPCEISAGSSNYGTKNLEGTLFLDQSLFITGTNTLRIQSDTDAQTACGASNYGDVRVVALSSGGSTNRTVITTYLSTLYQFTAHTFLELNFTWP